MMMAPLTQRDNMIELKLVFALTALPVCALVFATTSRTSKHFSFDLDRNRTVFDAVLLFIGAALNHRRRSRNTSSLVASTMPSSDFYFCENSFKRFCH
jgi:hypothetical protein